MHTQRWLFALLVLVLVSMSCNFLIGTSSPQDFPPPAVPANETAPDAATPVNTDITVVLEKLGGQPCEEKPDLTCVTINVPLDHFDTANSETVQVVFAVLPATGERHGMYVQAFPGGPGGEGISSAYPAYFDASILEHFDIVYFDQRGLGLSDPIACPTAYAADFLSYLNETNQAGLEGYDTRKEQEQVINDTRTFVEQCVAEMGIDPAKLAFYGTNQVAEDIESFRQAIGDEKFWLYGVSYGTAVAQTYAAAHSDHLAGLILDGTIDMTLTGEAGSFAQEKAFDKVLVATLKACDTDDACAADLGGDAVSVYDQLAEQISSKSLSYEFPLPSGEKAKRVFTFNQLEFTAAYQMYSLGSRTLFLRALAAAKTGDIVPMARLLYQQANLDPTTGDYIGDPTFSDTMFYDVNCTDDSYYSGTQEERLAKILADGQASNGTVPRLDGSIYSALYCIYWPSAPENVVRTEPLVAKDVPTFVLNATLDPATPFEGGKSVFEHLDNGYHIYVEGGLHSIYGWGETCPDDYITNFLINGELPSQREIVCQWDPNVIRAFIPIMAGDVSAFETPLNVFDAIDSELQRQPEYYYSDFTKDVTFGCAYGGLFTFGPSDTGENYSYEKCAFTQGFEITGTGSYNSDSGISTYDAEISGLKSGTVTYTHSWREDTASLSGEYDGKSIDLSR